MSRILGIFMKISNGYSSFFNTLVHLIKKLSFSLMEGSKDIPFLQPFTRKLIAMFHEKSSSNLLYFVFLFDKNQFAKLLKSIPATMGSLLVMSLYQIRAHFLKFPSFNKLQTTNQHERGINCTIFANLIWISIVGACGLLEMSSKYYDI